MKLHYKIEVDLDKKAPAKEMLEVDGALTECVAGCVRLISLIYSRTARHSKVTAEKFRQMVLVGLLAPDSPAFEIATDDVGNISDISAVFPMRRKE